VVNKKALPRGPGAGGELDLLANREGGLVFFNRFLGVHTGGFGSIRHSNGRHNRDENDYSTQRDEGDGPAGGIEQPQKWHGREELTQLTKGRSNRGNHWRAVQWEPE